MLAIVLLGTASRGRLATAQTASPAPLPPLDLGQTNILDGEGKQGALLEAIGLGYYACHANDASGRRLPGTNRQWIGGTTLYPTVVTGVPVLGGLFGGEALLPITASHIQRAPAAAMVRPRHPAHDAGAARAVLLGRGLGRRTGPHPDRCRPPPDRRLV